MFLLTAKSFFAQDSLSSNKILDKTEFRKNAVYGEIGGNAGGVFSLNYERKLFKNNPGFFTARAGVLININERASVLGGPAILINYISGKYKNHFEIGLGARLPGIISHDNLKNKYVTAWGDNDIWILVPTANLMYRYQKSEGKFLFRIGWTPLFYNATSSNASPAAIFYWFFVGASMGYMF